MPAPWSFGQHHLVEKVMKKYGNYLRCFHFWDNYGIEGRETGEAEILYYYLCIKHPFECQNEIKLGQRVQ